MKGNPGRKGRRRSGRLRKKGDLNRKSTHHMRSNMGMGSKPKPNTAIENKILEEHGKVQ